MRAISPSSRMISQMTAAGSRPARRARSTEPSVWPERTSTPPRRARSGKTWPGVTRSSGPASRATATRIVSARSRAEMPVVVPRRASMLTVKAVWRGERLSADDVMSGRPSAATRSSVSDRQMSPRPWRAMKLTASGVARSAASTRSPSFSRSSSSTRMTMRPARTSSMARATAARRSGSGAPGILMSADVDMGLLSREVVVSRAGRRASR